MAATGIQVIIISGPMALSVLSSFVKVIVRTAQVFLECMMIFTNMLIVVLSLLFLVEFLTNVQCCCDRKKQECKSDQFGAGGEEEPSRSYWRGIGWDRISELVQTVQVDNDWGLQNIDLDDDEATVAELAAPYWERPLAGPTWWCHVDPSHQGIALWLRNAQWLHPAVSLALRDESKLISERMKHIFYEVKFLSMLLLCYVDCATIL